MAGKLCTGQKDNNAGNIRNSKAFCEGLVHRMATNGATIGDNPLEAGSEAGDAWDRGWSVGQAASGSTVDPAAAPCCAVDTSITVTP